MALSNEQRKRIDSWFCPATRAEEAAWIDRLVEISALYQERGFTRGEGAILFMLNNLLFQVNGLRQALGDWHTDDSGDTPK